MGASDAAAELLKTEHDLLLVIKPDGSFTRIDLHEDVFEGIEERDGVWEAYYSGMVFRLCDGPFTIENFYDTGETLTFEAMHDSEFFDTAGYTDQIEEQLRHFDTAILGTVFVHEIEIPDEGDREMVWFHVTRAYAGRPRYSHQGF